MKKYHQIGKVEIAADELRIIVDGEEYAFQLSEISQKLANSSKMERERFEISPSGYGIHWPLIDEDLSVDGLLGIQHSPEHLPEKIVA